MKCPGQDSRYWKPGAIFDVKCPECGTMIEFFKDDTRRRCPSCGKDVPNPEMDFGCAAYCPYAEHCLGSLPEGVVADGKVKVLKAKMLRVLKEKSTGRGQDLALISRFMELVEEIGKKESTPLGPVLMAAFGYCLLGFGQSDSLSKKGFQKIEIEKIFKGMEIESDVIDEALKTLEHFVMHGEKDYSLPEKVIGDAWKLASVDYSENDSDLNETRLLTDAARQLWLSQRINRAH